MAEELKAEDKGYLNGVFYFSNNSDEEFVGFWNNKEYSFPGKTCSPMLIPSEPPENVQEIRKKWAYKWAEREWYKGSEYKKFSKMGGSLPPIRDDGVLEPLVQKCLEPLPIEKLVVREGKKKTGKIRGSKPVPKNANLNEMFKEENSDDNLTKLGEMSE